MISQDVYVLLIHMLSALEYKNNVIHAGREESIYTQCLCNRGFMLHREAAAMFEASFMKKHVTLSLNSDFTILSVAPSINPVSSD